MILVRLNPGSKPISFKIVKNDKTRRDKIIEKQLILSRLVKE
jgi:hypothetical protein